MCLSDEVPRACLAANTARTSDVRLSAEHTPPMCPFIPHVKPIHFINVSSSSTAPATQQKMK